MSAHRKKFALALTAIAAALTSTSVDCLTAPALAQNSSGDFQQSQQQKKLAAVNSIPFWSHDATGYHPALCVRLENLSNQDFTGQLIKMQCRFVDLRLGRVMLSRKEARFELAPNQGINLIFHGPDPYELPIDQYAWPLVECKLMSRIGDVDDSGTEDLLVQKLESVTMTDEEAIQMLSRGLYQHRHPKRVSKAQHETPKTAPRPPVQTAANTPEYKRPEQPLSAKALSLAASGKPTAPITADNRSALQKFVGNPKIPGLGSEFLEFEQLYGQPSAASLKTWSWIQYTKPDMQLDVYVGAKGSASKADLIAVKIPADQIQGEAQVVALAKAMSGKFRAQPLEHPHKSVKYQQLSEQRIRRILVTTMDANGYKLTYLTPRGTSSDDNNYIIILSRFTGDTVAMLPEMTRKAQMMRFLTASFGLPDQD